MPVGDDTQGRRIPDGEFLERCSGAGEALLPGDYGCEDITKCSGMPHERVDREWFVVCPDGSTTVLWVNEDDRNGSRHVITEHEDGTVSVGGSILGHGIPSERIGGMGPVSSPTWHGWLERGVWRKAAT